MARKWLFKSEPNTWSWEQQIAKGEMGEEWDGVRNYHARNFMRVMRVGDLGFFYHSLSEKSIVGMVEVIKEASQDSTTNDPRWQCVHIKAIQSIKNPVSLQAIKSHPDLTDMVLVKNSRLSVQPVTDFEWHIICQMSDKKNEEHNAPHK